MYNPQQARDHTGRWTSEAGAHALASEGLKGAAKKPHEATVHALRAAVSLAEGQDPSKHLDLYQAAVVALRLQAHRKKQEGQDATDAVAAHAHHNTQLLALKKAAKGQGLIPDIKPHVPLTAQVTQTKPDAAKPAPQAAKPAPQAGGLEAKHTAWLQDKVKGMLSEHEKAAQGGKPDLDKLFKLHTVVRVRQHKIKDMKGNQADMDHVAGAAKITAELHKAHKAGDLKAAQEAADKLKSYLGEGAGSDAENKGVEAPPAHDPFKYAAKFEGFEHSRNRPAVVVKSVPELRNELKRIRSMVQMYGHDTDRDRVDGILSSGMQAQDALERYTKSREHVVPIVRRSMDLLGKLFDEGRFRTIHEFPDLKEGQYGGEARFQIEKALGLANIDEPEKAPVYGSLGFSAEHSPPPAHKPFARNYGSCMVELHPHVMDRSTFTTRNTFRIPCHKEAVLNPEEAKLFHLAVGYQKPSDGYTETQILGGVTVSDIKALRFLSEDKHLADQALSMLKERNLSVPVYLQDKYGNLSQYGGK